MTSSSPLISSQRSHKPTRWLVTGGCGFIGTNLIKNLVDNGVYHIRVLDNLSVGARDDLAPDHDAEHAGDARDQDELLSPQHAGDAPDEHGTEAGERRSGGAWPGGGEGRDLVHRVR